MKIIQLSPWRPLLILFLSQFFPSSVDAAPTVVVSSQISSNPAPSLAGIAAENVRVALNFNGPSLTRDGIVFTGVTTTPSSAQFTNVIGDYKVVVWAPSGSLGYASAGSDSLFSTFIWATVQTPMGIRVEGLDPAKDYNIYYLCGDDRSNFNMMMTVSGTNGVQSASSSGLFSWGGSTSAYLPVYVSDVNVVDAKMAKNGNSLGVAFSGVIVAEATNVPPTLTTVTKFTGAIEDTAFTISYDDLADHADESDSDGSTLSFLVSGATNGTLTKNGLKVVSAYLSAGESVVWTPYIGVTNTTVQAFTLRANDGSFDSATAVPVMIDVAPAGSITNQPVIVLTNSIVSLAHAGTTNYTFTDTNSGASVTIAVTMSAQGVTNDNYFTFLDAINGVPTRVGLGFSGNWVDIGEKVKFSASLVSSSENVAADSIRFRIAAMGARNSGMFTNISSADTNVIITAGSEYVFSLDRLTASVSGTNIYTSEVGASTNYQLTDRPGYGISFSARFSVVDPVPSISLETVSAGSVKISWPEMDGYLLQQAADLSGPWADASLATTNGAVIATSGNARFYRLIKAQ